MAAALNAVRIMVNGSITWNAYIADIPTLPTGLIFGFASALSARVADLNQNEGVKRYL